jgi:hypothetical protein
MIKGSFVVMFQSTSASLASCPLVRVSKFENDLVALNLKVKSCLLFSPNHRVPV